MTDTPIAVEVDCSTGIATERPLTADEIAAQAKAQADAQAQQAAQEAAAAEQATKLAAVNTKLNALGLTADDIATLLAAAKN